MTRGPPRKTWRGEGEFRNSVTALYAKGYGYAGRGTEGVPSPPCVTPRLRSYVTAGYELRGSSGDEPPLLGLGLGHLRDQALLLELVEHGAHALGLGAEVFGDGVDGGVALRPGELNAVGHAG